jgi:RHS repeat-associated protein
MARYGYDPFGRRLWKEQYRDRSGQVLAQVRRSYYLYADEGLIAESRQDITLDASESVSAGAEPAIASQYGPRPDAAFTTGLLFVKTKNSNGDDTVAYYHHDHLETPIQATDKQGNVVWSAQYNVFGRATITTPAETPDKPTISSDLRLPGQVEDEETGLHYNWHRYYEPGLGRYVTADPIGLLDGVNRYAYVGGNPLMYMDPYGLFGMDDIWGFVYDITDGWSPSQTTVDIAAGFGDGISFGITKDIREWLDINGGVNICSASYKNSELIGNFVLPSAAALKIGKWFRYGQEFSFGLDPKKFRLAPFGNRNPNPNWKPHPYGRFPHYHRQGPKITTGKKKGQTQPGQSIDRHRPFEPSPYDKSIRDRF